MHYFILDIFCLVLTIVLLLYNHERSVFKDKRAFFYSLYVVLVFLAIFISGSMNVLTNFQINNRFLFFQTTLFLIVFEAILYVFTAYMFYCMYEDSKHSILYSHLTVIPFFCELVLLVVNGFTHCCFIIDEGMVHLNEQVFLLLLGPAIYVVYCTAFAVFSKERMTRRNKIVLMYLVVLICIVIGSQSYYFSQKIEIYLLGALASICMLIIYLFFQNKRGVFDELTGLCKRKILMKKIKLIGKSKHDQMICMIDLTNFKSINSKYGQTSGDKFIRSISLYLRKTFGVENTYRYGGDEFVFIVESDEKAKDKVNGVVNRFKEPFIVDNFEAVIPIHIGVIEYPKYALSNEDLCLILEELVEQAKEMSKEVALCDEQMVNAIREKHHMIDIMIKAIQNDNIEVFYQPIYSMEKKGFFNAEALIRIKDNGTMINPGMFIPVAEETGLVIDLDLIVFRKVLLFLKKVEALGLKIDGISTNFTPLHFMNPNFASEIIEMVDTIGVNPKKIKMEITESVFITNPKEAENVIKRLSKKGIRFYLDDFGTGYSNWTTVLDLPFDFIKIDRSLVVNGDNSHKGLIILQSTINALNANGNDVLTEGVETDNQLDLVKELGAKYVQGFYYSRPLPQEEFIEFLKKNQESGGKEEK